MRTIVTVFLLFALVLTGSAQSGSAVEGSWEGILTQEEGGYQPEYHMRLELKVKGTAVTGYAEVDHGDDVDIKTDVSGTLKDGFFLSLTDGLVINQKDLIDQEYCTKSYQLVLKKSGNRLYLKGRWKGVASENPCIPGKVILKRKMKRA